MTAVLDSTRLVHIGAAASTATGGRNLRLETSIAQPHAGEPEFLGEFDHLQGLQMTGRGSLSSNRAIVTKPSFCSGSPRGGGQIVSSANPNPTPRIIVRQS